MKRAARRVNDRNAAVSGYCLCRKAEYVTRRVAVRAAHDAEARGEGQHRVYPCPNKRRVWHITHLAPKGRETESVE